MIHLDTLLSLVNTDHTELQMDRFITVKSGLTPYGCLFQALRELHSRKQGLQSQYIAIARLEQSLETGTELDKLEKSLGLQEAHRKLKSIEREFLRFYSQVSALYVHLGFDKHYPTAEQLALLEEERWEHRILADVAVSILATGGISGPLISLIQCLPDNLRSKICNRCFGEPHEKTQKIQELTQWYMEYKFDLPEPLALTEQESRKILQCCDLHNLQRLLESSSQMDADGSLKSSTALGYQYVNHAVREEALHAGSVAAS